MGRGGMRHVIVEPTGGVTVTEMISLLQPG